MSVEGYSQEQKDFYDNQRIDADYELKKRGAFVRDGFLHVTDAISVLELESMAGVAQGAEQSQFAATRPLGETIIRLVPDEISKAVVKPMEDVMDEAQNRVGLTFGISEITTPYGHELASLIPTHDTAPKKRGRLGKEKIIEGKYNTDDYRLHTRGNEQLAYCMRATYLTEQAKNTLQQVATYAFDNASHEYDALDQKAKRALSWKAFQWSERDRWERDVVGIADRVALTFGPEGVTGVSVVGDYRAKLSHFSESPINSGFNNIQFDLSADCPSVEVAQQGIEETYGTYAVYTKASAKFTFNPAANVFERRDDNGMMAPEVLTVDEYLGMLRTALSYLPIELQEI